MLPLWYQLAFLTTASQPDKTSKGDDQASPGVDPCSLNSKHQTQSNPEIHR
jgi:hypothetical protein